MKLFSKDYIQQKKDELVADEEKWSQFRNACILIVFGFTSLLMSVVNFFTHQGSFTWITLGFSLACLIDLLLLRKKGAFAKAALAIFAVEITVVFIYFILSGIPEGFSVLWTAMVPCFGLLMYGFRTGTLLSLLMFLLLIFFFWMPIGNELLQYSYNATFKMRFPLLYLTFFVVAVLMENMRGTAYAALKDSQKKYEFLCYHDALTGLYNRFWLQTILAHPEKKQLKPAAIAVLDIDNFKFINDNFGHHNGDTVICRLGQTIVDTMNGSGELCRWGGDEFLILFHTDINAEGVCKRIVDAVRAQEFVFDSERVTTTVTVGLVIAPDGGTTDVDTMIRKADINLYHAKEQGKNCTITSQL